MKIKMRQHQEVPYPNPQENITGSPAGIEEQKKWEDQLMAVFEYCSNHITTLEKNSFVKGTSSLLLIISNTQNSHKADKLYFIGLIDSV